MLINVPNNFEPSELLIPRALEVSNTLSDKLAASRLLNPKFVVNSLVTSATSFISNPSLTAFVDADKRVDLNSPLCIPSAPNSSPIIESLGNFLFIKDRIYFSKALNISDLKKGWFWATEKDLKGNVNLNFDNSNNAKIQDDVKYFGLKCIELRRKYGN